LNFDYPGYDLKLVQTKPCNDGSAHLFSSIYKFYSPVTKLIYILTAEYHREDVFAIKFYAKKHRASDYKYSRIINKGDCGNILITCAKAVPMLLQDFPTASFGFIGSRTVDIRSKRVEHIEENQRFLCYRYIVQKKFGDQTFVHYEYPAISGYLLLNRACDDIEEKEQRIGLMFSETYQYVPDIIPSARPLSARY
jgi:hypothetical protein